MAYCKNRLDCKDFNPAGCGTLGVPAQCFNSNEEANESTNTEERGVREDSLAALMIRAENTINHW